MEECRAAYRVADEWFSFWRHGDVVPVGDGCPQGLVT